jgi:IS5 family transposase
MSTRDTADTTRKIRVASSSPARSAAVFGVIKRELRRRSAIEPIIGHLRADGHFGRCYLKGRAGDAANVILSAVGHNFRRILAWLRDFCRLILTALFAAISVHSALRSTS